MKRLAVLVLFALSCMIPPATSANTAENTPKATWTVGWYPGPQPANCPTGWYDPPEVFGPELYPITAMCGPSIP